MHDRLSIALSRATLRCLHEADQLIRLTILEARFSQDAALQALYTKMTGEATFPYDFHHRAAAVFDTLCDAVYLLKCDLLGNHPEISHLDTSTLLSDLDARLQTPLDDEGRSLADWCLERDPVVGWMVAQQRLCQRIAEEPAALMRALEQFQLQHLSGLLTTWTNDDAPTLPSAI